MKQRFEHTWLDWAETEQDRESNQGVTSRIHYNADALDQLMTRVQDLEKDGWELITILGNARRAQAFLKRPFLPPVPVLSAAPPRRKKK